MGDNGSFAGRWPELSGVNNWKDLLYPLDFDLRRYILLHGDLAGTVAINDEKVSRWYGYSRYAKEDLFSKVGLNKDVVDMYEVTKFIYATSDLEHPEPLVADAEDPNSTIIGIVAVSTEVGTAQLGRRNILIVWRGTVTKSEMDIDEKFAQTSAEPILGKAHNPLVHRGWYSYYTSSIPGSKYNNTSARVQVHEEITRLTKFYEHDPEMSITLVGHSMGSALATLNAVDIANGYHGLASLPTAANNCLISAFLFASPRVGDLGFRSVFDGLDNLHLLRISNHLDPVKDVPPEICICPPAIYTHVGQDLRINAILSPYLKTDHYGALVHQLEIYLHGVAGTQGPEGDFKLEVDRDLALANKSLDAVKDKYLYPVAWWVRQNKGMVQQGDSTWEFVDDHQSEPN